MAVALLEPPPLHAPCGRQPDVVYVHNMYICASCWSAYPPALCRVSPPPPYTSPFSTYLLGFSQSGKSCVCLSFSFFFSVSIQKPTLCHIYSLSVSSACAALRNRIITISIACRPQWRTPNKCTPGRPGGITPVCTLDP